MMKKITIISLFSALSCSSFTYAGGMGDVGVPCFTSFISLEGGLSDNTINKYNLVFEGVALPFTQTKSNKGISGRIAVGAGSKIEDLAVTGEMGWGYYGTTKVTITGPSNIGTFTNNYALTGFDILAGIAWVPSNFILYLKAGAMIQNMGNTATATITLPAFSGIFALDNNRTQALPEVKIGIGYSFADNWAITVAGLAVFGTSVKASGVLDLTAGSTDTNVKVYDKNPSIGAVLVGLQYSI